MKWLSYKRKIIEECISQNKSDKYTHSIIVYAKKLFDKKLPVIYSPLHFSLLVGIDHQYVCNMAYSTNRFYRSFRIPKKNGGFRKIEEPLPDLKYVQNWILKNILEKQSVSDYAKAFVKGRSIKHNARFHRSQKVVVTVDIKDFFPSIKIKDVTNIFLKMGYNLNLACFLAHLCCLNGTLPQGAPTSPYISNLRMMPIDNKMVKITKPDSIRYTRYADDMTFSGDFNPHNLIKSVSETVFEAGFQLNSKKTRVARSCARQEVTGIVVNSHLQLPKLKRKKIRQEVYYINRFGLDSHLTHIGETRAHYLEHLLGQINFCLFINPKDKELERYYSIIKEIYLKNKTSK